MQDPNSSYSTKKTQISSLSMNMWRMIFDFLEDHQFYNVIPLACKNFYAIIKDDYKFRTFACVCIYDKGLTFNRPNKLLNLEKVIITATPRELFAKSENSLTCFQFCKNLKEIEILYVGKVRKNDSETICESVTYMISFSQNLVSLKIIMNKVFSENLPRKITEKHALNLSQASLLNLTKLCLIYSQITDEGALHLSRANWPNLTH